MLKNYNLKFNNRIKKQKSNHKAKSGFTLAEVLLVITVIGIVASLTLPSLIVSIQETEMTVSTKKAYSEICAAWKNYIEDNGGTPVGKFTSTDDLRTNFLREYFAYSQVTSLGSNTRIFQSLNSTNYYTNNVGITKSNGVYIGFGNASPTCTLQGYANLCAQLVMDVNGKKGPNRDGYDVFWFNLMTDSVFPGDARYGANHVVNTTCIEPGHTNWNMWYNQGNGCIRRILINQTKWSG